MRDYDVASNTERFVAAIAERWLQKSCRTVQIALAPRVFGL